MAKMLTNQIVYQGPSTSYSTVGSVSAGEQVEFMWKESSWVYIKYTVGSTGFSKCGYVPAAQVSGAGTTTFTPSLSTRYIGMGCIPFFGPSNIGYSHVADAIKQKETVQYTGKKIGSYAFVQYGNNKRFWIFDNNLSTTMPTTGGYYTIPKFSYNFIQSANSEWNKLNSEFTLKGCVICCAADVASFAEQKSCDPEVMYNRGVFSSSSILCNWSNASTYLSWADIEYASASTATYLEQIKYHINSGLPVVIKMENSSHWVVAYGYINGAASSSDVYVRDPFSADRKNLKQALTGHQYAGLKFVYLK